MAVHVKKIKEGGAERRGEGALITRGAPGVFVDKGAYMQMVVPRQATERKSFSPLSVSPVYSVSLGARIMPSLTVYRSRERGV